MDDFDDMFSGNGFDMDDFDDMFSGNGFDMDDFDDMFDGDDFDKGIRGNMKGELKLKMYEMMKRKKGMDKAIWYNLNNAFGCGNDNKHNKKGKGNGKDKKWRGPPKVGCSQVLDFEHSI